MNIERLLQERNDLRDKIEEKRKVNEQTVMLINGFYNKVAGYVEFCIKNGVGSSVWHEMGDNKYLITCTKNSFCINLYNPHASSGCGTCYCRYEEHRISHSLAGSPTATLSTITQKNGELTSNAMWFKENIEKIIQFVDEDIENCILKQIEEAKTLLGETE